MKKFLFGILGLLFAVPAVAATLPAGYTELEYISTESASGPYIDTGLTAGSNTRVLAQYKLNSVGFTSPISVRDENAAGAGFGVGINGSQQFISDYNGDRKVFTTITPNATDIITVDKNKNVCTITIGGQSETVTNTVSTFTTTNTLPFFAQNSVGTVSVGRYTFYSFKMWNNDTLVRDLIPAKNSSNVIGMYDMVSGTFFTNAGTGTFTAGPVIPRLPNEYQAITPDDTETYPETLSGYTLFINDGGNWGIVTAASGGADYYRFKIGSGNIVASDTKMISNMWNRAGISSDNKLVGFAVYYSSAGSSYISVRDQSKFTSISTLNTYLASNPLMVLYKSTTATNNEFVAVRRLSDGALGYYCERGTNEGAFISAYGMTTSTQNGPIKIATIAYNSARFSPVVTELNDTIATIRSVVTNTINQTKAIADLQATKQTRPDETCPAGKKCLLVEDDAGQPHWYEIIESPEVQ